MEGELEGVRWDVGERGGKRGGAVWLFVGEISRERGGWGGK